MSIKNNTEKDSVYLNTIINNMVQGVITVDKIGTIKSFNKRAEDIFQYKAADIVGKKATILMPQPKQYKYGKDFTKYLQINSAKGEGIGREVFGRKSNGDLFPIFLTIIETNIDSEPVFISLILEMTDQKERETRLENLRLDAEKANQAKSDFLANMSHELRTPLNSILGLTRMFVEDPTFTGDNRSMAQTIYKSASNLLENVNDILDISKIESGNIELENISFDFQDVVVNVVETLSPIAQDKGIFLEYYSSDNKIPLLMGDPFRLNLILTNFVGNSIKYMHEGEIDIFTHGEGDIQIVTKTKKINATTQEIFCSVNDTGIGISDDKLDVIFDKFIQADLSTTRKYGGTGLGLSIAKELVQRMGGEIGVNSKINQGSQFWFKIPFEISTNKGQKNSSQFQKERRKRKRNTNDVLIPAQKAKVLVAEDHLLNQDFITRLLKRIGFESITLTDNGQETLNILDKHSFDLILMDCHMPEKNGYEVTQEIRKAKKSYSQIPIVALTADAMKGTKAKCLHAGMDDYASKPINPDELRSILEQWIIFNNQKETPTKAMNINPPETPVDMSVMQDYAVSDSDIDQFIDLFLKQSKEGIALMAANYHANQNEIWHDAAHKLKGGSGMFGAKKLYQLCAKAQEMEEETDEDRQLIIEEIQAEYNIINDYLVSYRI